MASTEMATYGPTIPGLIPAHDLSCTTDMRPLGGQIGFQSPPIARKAEMRAGGALRRVRYLA